MSEYGPWLRGSRIADVYDDWCDSLEGLDTAGAVDMLAKLAADGPVLELGIGTGRLALPLAESGLEMHGIDTSPEMLARLREKAGADQLELTEGDMADVGVSELFRLVFVAFNTFFALPTQDEQIRCFANVAKHLLAGGLFVIEAFVPDLARFAVDGPSSTQRIDLEDVTLVDTAVHHRVEQSVESSHIVVRSDGIDRIPVSIRYAYPSELDLMARLAGMCLRERWSGWRREPFDDASREHVSVYELDGSLTGERGAGG